MISHKHAFSALIIISAVFYSFATDGIAVSYHWDGEFGSKKQARLMQYNIKDDKVAGEQVLVPGDFTCHWPAINHECTQVVFFKHDMSSGDNYLSMVPVDGGEVKDLVKLNSLAEYHGDGFLDWPKGAWVYYNLGRKNEGSSYLRRHNVETGADELYIKFNTYLYTWGMSGDAKRMHVLQHVPLEGGDKRGRYKYLLPGDGTLDPAMALGGGCNNYISPSGNYLCNLSDAGHANLSVYTWDMNEDGESSFRYTIRADSMNLWPSNVAEDEKMTCSNGRTYQVGSGYDLTRWAVNSEKWICGRIGWTPKGRFMDCGANQVLVNWADKKIIRVSNNPRTCKSSDQAGQCDLHVDGPRQVNEAGDFFVLGPDSDIDAVNISNDYLKRGAQVQALLKDNVNIYTKQNKDLLIEFGDTGHHTISIADMQGKRIIQLSGNARLEAIDGHHFAGGMYLVKLGYKGQMQSRAIGIYKR